MTISTTSTLQAPTQVLSGEGINYAYRHFGSQSGVPLLCLQHFTGTLDLWDPLVFDALSAKRSILLFANPGVGRSTGAPPDNVASMVQHAISLLGALKITQVDILGFSLGGFLGQYIALNQPSLVRKLILVGTGPEGGEGTSMGRPDLLNVFFDQKMRMPEKIKRLFFSQSAAGQKAAEAYLSRISKRTDDHDTAASGEVAVNQLKAMAVWENSKGAGFSDLYRITQPVLVLNGNNDILIPTANSFTLNAHLPNAALAIYPDSGHGSLYQYPITFISHVEEFLSRD